MAYGRSLVGVGACALLLLGCSGGDGTSDSGVPLDEAGNPIGPDSGTPDTGPELCNGIYCGTSELCLGMSCGCIAGYAPTSSGCAKASPGSAASHPQADVCKKWKDGHVVTAPNPYTAGVTCAPGTLSAGGILDAVVRVNMFRWMVGLADVTDDATRDTGAQACAIIQGNNNPGSFASPHQPPPSATCYSALGAQYSGMSNLAWGTSNASSIDLYVQDPGAGNAGSIGHRRWVLYPVLGKVGVGFVSGGNNGYGGLAQCLAVIGDTSNVGARPDWYAWPPPGFSPVQVSQGVVNAGWAWTFHVKKSGALANATIAVTNLNTAEPAPVTVKTLGQGYGDDAIAFYPNGWTPTAGETYRVKVGATGGPFLYDVSPVTCP